MNAQRSGNNETAVSSGDDETNEGTILEQSASDDLGIDSGVIFMIICIVYFSINMVCVKYVKHEISCWVHMYSLHKVHTFSVPDALLYWNFQNQTASFSKN